MQEDIYSDNILSPNLQSFPLHPAERFFGFFLGSSLACGPLLQIKIIRKTSLHNGMENSVNLDVFDQELPALIPELADKRS